MKRFQLFSLASAMLLASAAGFTSCSSDSEDPQAGGSGVAGQVVKTQFALNIPYGGDGSSTNQAKQGTRMTSYITQQNKVFHGITDIVLLTFNGDPTTESITDATSIIEIGNDNNTYAQDNYRRLYRDIEIPTGTSYMAFYGRARRNSYTDFEAGRITDVGEKKSEKTLANISHQLTPIKKDANFTTDNDANTIIEALNNIAGAKVTVDNTTYTWATIGNEQNLPTWLTEHEKEFLKSRYSDFIALKAGSQTYVKAFIENLQKALAGETTGATVPDDKKLTKEIYTRCENALKSINSINFPGKFNLPDGVASLSWEPTESKFTYCAPGSSTFVTGTSIDYQKICYPAELVYFVNSKTMVSDKDMSNLNEFPTYENWIKQAGADWAGKNFFEKAVENSTRTVGLKDPVQYSVAVLKSTVRCNTAKLEDNAQAAGGFKANQSITVSDKSFPVTGILIGGQPASVDWKYEPATTEETFANTIYDNVMNGSPMYAKNENPASNANYTLVFDNKSTDKKTVYVTIELKNNSGMDFYGNNGIILKGAKFYLVGKLEPEATTGTPKPTGVDRVFMQDHITTANFNIKSLKEAYNCIPDLRTSGINVGLAVDLSWQDGITFDVDL